MKPSTHKEPESPREAWPKHIAIIMDGNGRWAGEQGKPRIAGHQAGAVNVRLIIEHCAYLGIGTLTLYSFSSENWKRPQSEIDALMQLCREHLISERDNMVQNDIRLVRIGRDEGLPQEVLDEIRRTEEATAHCTSMTLVLAINYGSRAEIVDAVRSIANDALRGDVDPALIDEALVASRLYTAGLPDPDLLIRTAGEQRLSNYLLWQISYAEIYVTNLEWPRFDEAALNRAIDDFASRTRRFGGVQPDPGSAGDGSQDPETPSPLQERSDHS